MNFLSRLITAHKKIIVTVFFIFFIICGILTTMISINNNLIDYLPKDAESTIALDLMETEFGGTAPNTKVMISNITLPKAKEYKEKLKEIDGVTDVLWLDDVMNIKEPLEIADKDTLDEYYKDNAALFTVTIKEGSEAGAIDAIYKLDDENITISGEAASTAFSQSMTSAEATGAMIILIPIITGILLLTTTSWFEPLLYFSVIGVAIVINLGLTTLTGEISFVSMAVGPILQLAVSLDYSIFLLHSFEKHRKETGDITVAMQQAIKSSFSSIAASAATTLFGFLALLLMKFRIGSDMGMVMCKGIIFSYICVMVFLPALTLCCYKLIDKTKHKRIMPDLGGIGKALMKIRIPALFIAVVLVIPCFLAQGKTDYIYGIGTPEPTTKYGVDTIKINKTFGQSTSMVILVPKGEPAKESALSNELKEQKNIISVISYAASVSPSIPEEFLSHDVTKDFYSENYARIILSCDTSEESKEAFTLVENARNITAKYYDTSYSCGQSANLYDMKKVVSADNALVNMVAIIAIGFTLFVTFKSLTLPLILLSVIETAIWINLAFPYFLGSSLSYIGYLIINTVQLGATIDYAILFTTSYMGERQSLGKKGAMLSTLKKNILSIMVSVLILAGAGLCLNLTSSNSIVNALGLLLGRGTILSFTLVMSVLPPLLLIFDKLIAKTTYKVNFYKDES
ncbi:MAG: MMPL family transporter [Anaerocolumna sp.]